MAERQLKFEQRLKDGDKKQYDFEKKRRQALRTKRDQIEEKTIEADEKRAQVKKDLQQRDNKAYEEYRRDLRAKRE